MAKYYGKIGYAITEETGPGVWTEQIIERSYQGDVVKNYRRLDSPNETLNDNINISNDISIVADAFAYNNFHSIRWIEWMGTKWKVTGVTVEHPRLNLNIGGVYHGEV